MEDERFKSEMMRLMDLVIQKLGGLDARFDNLENDAAEIKLVQKEHSQSLKRLEDKTDSIAEVVLRNDMRLTNLEKEVQDLRDAVH